MNLPGNLLIAPPAVQETFWDKSVILVTEHYSAGSVGLIINKRSSYSIVEIGDRLNLSLEFPGYVYIGGPINTKVITILHTNDWKCKNTN